MPFNDFYNCELFCVRNSNNKKLLNSFPHPIICCDYRDFLLTVDLIVVLQLCPKNDLLLCACVDVKSNQQQRGIAMTLHL